MTKPTLISYISGFLLSLLLTIVAYDLVTKHIFVSNTLTYAVLGLALVQLIIQLVFFLHMASESKPHWKLSILISTVSIVLIIIIGSLWIMNNLNYRHMSADEANTYLLQEEGIQK